MIPVTKPFFPPVDQYMAYIDEIWTRGWITNNGPLVNELELQLKQKLSLDHLLFLGNGTIALQIAIKCLALKGEIITTPFSYVATTSSIVWENCKPVFADVLPDSLNIDPASAEKLISPATTAIIATHTYGNACDIDALEEIAGRHKLKLIFDAAHCFGTRYKGKSIFEYGTITATSFHATKIYHTVEGGAVITRDPELLKAMAYMRNFGHNGPDNFQGVGINGKNSELHAAMGLLNLRYIDAVMEKRKLQFGWYSKWFPHLQAKTVAITKDCEFNHAYLPLIFDSGERLIKAIELLNAHMVYPRRYFFPALNKLSYVTPGHTPVCDDLADRVLCLPLYDQLAEADIDFICRLLLRNQNN